MSFADCNSALCLGPVGAVCWPLDGVCLASVLAVHCPLPHPPGSLIVIASALARLSVVVVKHFDQKELGKERLTKGYSSQDAPPTVGQWCLKMDV